MSDTLKLQAIVKPPVKILLMYIVSALLFLTSVELHIHTKESTASVDHGYAVAISTLTDKLMNGNNDEINVSADSVLKAKYTNLSLLAVFLLIAILVTFLASTFVGRLRQNQLLLPKPDLYATPPLRAPPQ